jgi:hypothetical protein
MADGSLSLPDRTHSDDGAFAAGVGADSQAT